jgi:tetratricopeptide (TPR) repeat protein
MVTPGDCCSVVIVTHAFDLQVDIASRIAAELSAALVPTPAAGSRHRPTDSPEAYALYLEAVSLGGRENSNDRRIALLDQAIAFDDGFAGAYALRANTYAARVVDNTTGDGVSVAARPDHERLARADAERALGLDPTNMQALAALGMIDVVSWHWNSARVRLGRAILEEDASVSALPVFAFILGQDAAAIRSARRAVELSPNDWLPYRFLGWVLVLARDYDGAHDALRKGIELAPNRAILHRWMAYVAAARGDTADALKGAQPRAGPRILELDAPSARRHGAPDDRTAGVR